MESEIASPPGNAEPGFDGFHGPPPPAATRPRRFWWLVAVLAVCASLILGGSVEHAIDQRNAAHSLYQMQVLTTASRFFDEEQRQIALPVVQRSASAFGDLAESIGADMGVNRSGMLPGEPGAGQRRPACADRLFRDGGVALRVHHPRRVVHPHDQPRRDS